MKEELINCAGLQALLLGGASDRVFVYVHGAGGSRDEARPFAESAAARGWQVLSVDLPGHGKRLGCAGELTPWHMERELRALGRAAAERWPVRGLYAVSIGAWFALTSLCAGDFAGALFLSPVVDMAALIRRMMRCRGVSEDDLRRRGIIPADHGEALSWEYFQWALAHAPEWTGPSEILYASGDELIPREDVEAFVRRRPSSALTVMQGGEHWLHTPEETAFLRSWEARCLDAMEEKR